MTSIDKTSVRFAIAAFMYAIYALQGFLPIYNVAVLFMLPFFVSSFCASVILVAMLSIVKSGPIWAKVVAGILALPVIWIFVGVIRGWLAMI
jgi:hypothetical protein